MIFIISAADDVHAKAVIAALNADREPVRVLNLADFPLKMALTAALSNTQDEHYCLTLSDRTRVELDTVKAFWWRRPQPFTLPTSIGNPTPSALASLRRCSCQSGVRCPWRDSAQCARPTYGCLILALVRWSNVSLACGCHVLAPATCFFDCRTLPARRGASKRSRLNDHGPQRDPRGRRSSRVKAFLTRRSFRAGAFTPSKTARRE
jgi:hypothetical protein